MLPIGLSGSQCVQSMLSTKNHPRYHIRLIAIGSVAVGIFFNILSIAICKDYILQGLAFLLLCISMIWHHVDLASPHFHKQRIPVALLAFVDGLGFCSFLALLIANGIISKKRWRGYDKVILMTYASVPWISCCAIHGFIALHNIYQLLPVTGNAMSVCTECCRSWKPEHTNPQEATDGAYNSLLGQKNNPEYDPEADTSSDYVVSNGGGENVHTLAA